MTEQEFNNVNWNLVSQICNERYLFTVLKCADIPHLSCRKRVFLKDGEPTGKMLYYYCYKNRNYFTKQKLLEVLNDED